jgi:hypothetical protein
MRAKKIPKNKNNSSNNLPEEEVSKNKVGVGRTSVT